MRNIRTRELTVEEFDERIAADERYRAIADAADEAGGPRLSLVPAQDQTVPWPTDSLPPAPASAPADGPATEPDTDERDANEPHADSNDTGEQDAVAPVAAQPDAQAAAQPAAQPAAQSTATPFDGVALTDSRNRLVGWSADRQRFFLTALAETGSVHLASATARLSARGAYKLRQRSPEFAAAWDTAEQLAAGRLSALAFDRAINGRIEQVWHQGVLMMEKRVPSDRLLMWLLARLDPRRFAAPGEQPGDGADPQTAARAAFPGQLDGLADLPLD